MTIEEAKYRIKQEFIEKFNQWLTDYTEMPDREYERKYGYSKGKVTPNDNLMWLVWFQGHIFAGRWLPEWEKVGFTRQLIYQLHLEGFLSYQEYSNWTARMTGETSFYFINQKVAKQIYKEWKKGQVNINVGT